MSYIELAWRRDESGITHVDERIKDLLGYSAQEIKDRLESASLTPWLVEDNFEDLLSGPPNGIASHTYAPCPLRRKDGLEILCQVTAICRYNERGCLAELFGTVCEYPRQKLLRRFLNWWRAASDTDREAVCGLADLLRARA